MRVVAINAVCLCAVWECLESFLLLIGLMVQVLRVLGCNAQLSRLNSVAEVNDDARHCVTLHVIIAVQHQQPSGQAVKPADCDV